MKKAVTVIVLILAIMICGACNSPQEIDDLKSQIVALEQLIASQQRLVDDLKTKNAEFQNKFGENDQSVISMREKIDKLQKQNDLYKAQINNLSGIPIEFTAEKPIYEPRGEVDESVVFNTPGSAYREFSDYFEQNHPYGEKNVLAFKHNDNDDIKMYDEYYAVRTKAGEVLITQYLIFYDEIFGSYDKDKYVQIVPGRTNYSLSMQFYWGPTYSANNRFTEFEIEFGHYYVEHEIVDKILTYETKYFNIFSSGICIGTCYYSNCCYISHTGIQDYIVNRLTAIKGAEK